MDKIEVTPIERRIYEYYLIPIVKKSRLEWNQTTVPNRLKKIAKEIVKIVEENYQLKKK